MQGKAALKRSARSGGTKKSTPVNSFTLFFLLLFFNRRRQSYFWIYQWSVKIQDKDGRRKKTSYFFGVVLLKMRHYPCESLIRFFFAILVISVFSLAQNRPSKCVYFIYLNSLFMLSTGSWRPRIFFEVNLTRIKM